MLFTFPSRYLFTIGRKRVFSLGRWSSQIPTGFHVSRSTRVSLPERPCRFAYGTITPCGRPFQGRSTTTRFCNFPDKPEATPQPCRYCYPQFGLFPFRSPLLRESRLISVPGGTEMFHFPPLAFRTYEFSAECCRITDNGLPHSEIPGSKPA